MAQNKHIGLASVLAWLTVFVVLGLIVACAPHVGGSTSAVESYDLCTSDPDYGNAPCVVLSLVDGRDAYTWVAVAKTGDLVFVDMLPCASDDGPAPCVWDTRHGNTSAGPNVRQFVMVRD